MLMTFYLSQWIFLPCHGIFFTNWRKKWTKWWKILPSHRKNGFSWKILEEISITWTPKFFHDNNFFPPLFFPSLGSLPNFVKMAKIAFFGIFMVNFMYLNLIRLSSPVYMFSEMSYILGFYQFWDHKWTPLLPVWNGRHFLATKMIIFMFFNCKTTKNTTQLTFFSMKI